MADLYSAEMTVARASGFNAPNKAGHVTRLYFSYSGAISNNGDILHLLNMPAAARFMGGQVIVSTAFGTGISATMGIPGAAGRYSGAINLSSAGANPFGNNGTYYWGEELSTTAETELRLTVTALTSGGSGVLSGYVDVLLN